ncbi:MAG: tetratricopeptide repeat protein, partial [Phycisphaerae bacterium]|nr:tetratricopeptide repeat protein [Phycisphaerae bacterium]
WAFSVPQRLLIAGQALWFYTSKLLWPHPLAFIYPRWDIDQAAGWQYVFPVSAAAVMLALVLARRRIGKGPGAGVLFFAGTLVPALGFVNVYPMRFSFVADHFQYLASIGLIALGCASLRGLGVWLGRVGQWGAVVAAVAAVMVLAMLTRQQTMIYRSEETLWRDTLTKNPHCFLAHNNLGAIYYSQAIKDSAASRASLDRALVHCSAAAQLQSDYPEVLHNLGRVYLQLGRYAEAAGVFRQALTLKPKVVIPNFEASLHFYLASALAKSGNIEEGIVHYREATRLDPHTAEAYSNLGVLLLRKGQVQEAAEACRQAIAIQPDLFEAHQNLGSILEVAGDFPGAAEAYQAALALSPTNGHTHRRLAFVLAKLGAAQPAVAAFNESVRLIGPDDAAAATLKQILKETAGAEVQRPSP